MGKLKLFHHSYPKWDYIHPTIIQTHPIIQYYFPNDSIESVYTIKIYWKSNEMKEGFGLIMDSSELPHQGKCTQTFEIRNGKIDSTLPHDSISLLNHVFDFIR